MDSVKETLADRSFNAKLFSEAIEPIQMESALSLGMTKKQAVVYVILPQAVSISVPAFVANVIFLLKETSVFSAISLMDLMFTAKDLIGLYYKTAECLFLLVVFYLIKYIIDRFCMKTEDETLRRMLLVFYMGQVVFFLFYTASGFVSCAKLFSSVFGIPYIVSLLVGAVVVISYTFAGGFFAVCWTDFFQGLMMFFCVVAVPLIAVFRMGGPAEFISSVEAFNPNFLSMFVDGATNTPYTAMGIVSLVAWGLGYFGQPHILVRFMGISSPAAIKKSRRIATVWVVISLTAAVMIGVSGRMVLGDGLLDGNGQQEIIYITMVSKFFPLFIAGIFLSAILAAIMSTADSQLLVTASALTKDFYHNKIRPQATEKELMWVSRGCVMGVAVIAVLIATNQNSTVLGLVSYAWGGFGSAFGPLVLCSLFWKRTNKQGAYAGILVGGIVDLVWAQLSGGIFDLYEIVPGFVCGLIAIFVVSLLTAAPSKEITDEFDSYRSCEE